MTRRMTRRALATGILVFAAITIAELEAQTAAAPLLAGLSALLLLLLLRGVTVAARRRDRQS